MSPTLDTGVGYVRFERPLADYDWLGQTVLLQRRLSTLPAEGDVILNGIRVFCVLMFYRWNSCSSEQWR